MRTNNASPCLLNKKFASKSELEAKILKDNNVLKQELKIKGYFGCYMLRIGLIMPPKRGEFIALYTTECPIEMTGP